MTVRYGVWTVVSVKGEIMTKQARTCSFSATCGRGTEHLVAGEIESCGGTNIVEGVGAVVWQGSLASGYRACLWSRCASRILLRLASFPVSDEETLYHDIGTIDWSEHLSNSSSFAVDCTVGRNSLPIHSGFGALKVKDIVVDQFREQTGRRPDVDTRRPDVRINLLITEKEATVFIDLSGDSLHRRGYRVAGSKAPLKENLAASLVRLSGWDNTPLIDPMCGSGTLLIEAALLHGDSAPGLSRTYFGFMGWKGHDSSLWAEIVAEALEREEQGNKRDWPVIVGYDSDPGSVKAARKNISKAGLDNRIKIECSELANLRFEEARGMILSNLPFGERLSEQEEVKWLYRGMGRILKQGFDGWKVALFISQPGLADSFGLSWQEKFQLYNGTIRCRLLLSEVVGEVESPFVWTLHEVPALAKGQDFANRLKKNLKNRLKWAKREGHSCFRVYDRDLPEYNVCIDIYGKFIHVQEFAAPESVKAEVAAERFKTVLYAVRELLGVRSDRVFVKTRKRQRGTGQYQKKSTVKKMVEVEEGSCRYLVNFKDYLDTGLFLDHRPTRLRIFRDAAGKDFLNLFGYTGTASVQAAKGGARSTTTVDLSENYLSWTRMNLYLNGYDTVTNRVERADCMTWLKECKDKFDLIFVDPPTFSNTKKEKRVFDVQRDHVQLLTFAMSRLTTDGVLIFSTNFRRFKLDKSINGRYLVSDISHASIPEDFGGKRNIHKCWELRKRV